MKPFEKVVLYGVNSGMELCTIGERNILVTLENGEKVAIPEYLTKSADKIIDKDNIKLKDVIARIEKLDIGTQKVWLDEILNKLGSDYGTLKYKAGYEQGKFEGSLIPYDGPQKVKVSEEEAKFLETFDFKREIDVTTALYHVSRTGWGYYLRDNNGIELKNLTEGFEDLENRKRLIKAILDGYEVEKEKRYTVKMKNLRALFCYLAYIPDEGYWSFMASGGESIIIKHTHKELEEAGFGEVFDSPLFEVEEVEE